MHPLNQANVCTIGLVAREVSLCCSLDATIAAHPEAPISTASKREVSISSEAMRVLKVASPTRRRSVEGALGFGNNIIPEASQTPTRFFSSGKSVASIMGGGEPLQQCALKQKLVMLDQNLEDLTAMYKKVVKQNRVLRNNLRASEERCTDAEARADRIAIEARELQKAIVAPHDSVDFSPSACAAGSSDGATDASVVLLEMLSIPWHSRVASMRKPAEAYSATCCSSTGGSSASTSAPSAVLPPLRPHSALGLAIEGLLVTPRRPSGEMPRGNTALQTTPSARACDTVPTHTPERGSVMQKVAELQSSLGDENGIAGKVLTRSSSDLGPGTRSLQGHRWSLPPRRPQASPLGKGFPFSAAAITAHSSAAEKPLERTPSEETLSLTITRSCEGSWCNWRN